MLERVAQNGWALADATVELKGDLEVVMTAVAQEGWALKYATDELRGDHEVVMTAVSQDGWALQFATEELRGDREVAMKAVAQNGLALEYATEELRGDREVVMAAVARSGYAVQYAADELRDDKEIMEAALARASAQEAAPVGLKARLNPASLLSSKKGGKAQQHLLHFWTLHIVCTVLKGQEEAFSFFCVRAELENLFGGTWPCITGGKSTRKNPPGTKKFV